MKRCAGFDLDIAGQGDIAGPGSTLTVQVQVQLVQRAGAPVTPARTIIDERVVGRLTSDGVARLPSTTWTFSDEASAPGGHPCAERMLLHVNATDDAAAPANVRTAEIAISDSQSGLAADAGDGGWTAVTVRGDLVLQGPLGLTLTLRPHHVFVD